MLVPEIHGILSIVVGSTGPCRAFEEIRDSPSRLRTWISWSESTFNVHRIPGGISFNAMKIIEGIVASYFPTKSAPPLKKISEELEERFSPGKSNWMNSPFCKSIHGRNSISNPIGTPKYFPAVGLTETDTFHIAPIAGDVRICDSNSMSGTLIVRSLSFGNKPKTGVLRLSNGRVMFKMEIFKEKVNVNKKSA